MERIEAVKTRGNLFMKLGRLGAEVLAPAAVLMAALPANGMAIGSAQSYAVAFCYVLVASALKVFVVDVAKARIEEKGASLVEFFVASAVFYSVLALGMLKAFELATS